MKLFAFFGIFAFTEAKQIWYWGKKCVEAPVIADFDIERYKGQWNEVARYPNYFQDDDAQCVRALYSDRDDFSVKVNNTQIYERDGVRDLTGGVGQAVQEIDDKPNWLTVTFNLESAFASWISKLFTSKGNYKMMDTDYDNYAVVMGCERYWFITVEQAWVLARDPNFLQTDQYRELMDNAIENWGMQEDLLVYSEHSDCSWDIFTQFDPDSP
ncbi:Oidioi.mRNA.OKI2018_I69.PAR.g11056.t1.cds [Oikopleura dioica]|uniref:Oidioi.mRNA.OKI2018_I69.PAR.g11056.t1.cds n=1 Tax=Oikopleura dioica TaxID=34765 RepID=A0ABN7RUJ5_OIKDI|nr:Oidioi.mRNA.OKI2018_I69.PAR.g11056.t1.cds [Oikopleura dioica]